MIGSPSPNPTSYRNSVPSVAWAALFGSQTGGLPRCDIAKSVSTLVHVIARNGFLNCSLPSLMPALQACERLSVVDPFLSSLLFRVGCESPIAARTRQMLRRIHHEEHEGHEEWNGKAVKCDSYLCNVPLEGCSKANSLLHLTCLRTKPSTSSSHSFVFFVSFVVKQSHTSVRSLALNSFSSVTHLSLRNASALFSWVLAS